MDSISVRELRLVLEDVLKTEIGRRYLRRSGCVQLSAIQSKSRRESQTPRWQLKPADHQRNHDDPQTRPADQRKRSEDTQPKAADQRRRFEDPQAKAADQRTRFEDPQPRSADQRRRHDDLQPPHTDSPKLKNATSLKAKATDSDQPKLITSSRIESDHSEQPKPISTSKSKPVSSEDSTNTRSPSRSQRCVEHGKPRAPLSDTHKPFTSLTSSPDTPKSLTASGHSGSSDTLTAQQQSSFGGRQIQVQVEVHALPSAMRTLRTTTDQPNHTDPCTSKQGDASSPRKTCSDSTRHGSVPSVGLSPSAPNPLGRLRTSGPVTVEEPRPQTEAREVPPPESAVPERVTSRRASLIHTHKSAQDTRLGTTAAESPQQEEVMRRKRRSCENGLVLRNGTTQEAECVQRKSVLCLSGDSGGAEEPPIKCPRLTSLSEEQPTNEERQSLIRAPLHVSQSEPIVLSSEEEEEEEEESCAAAPASEDEDGDEDEDSDEEDDGDDDDGGGSGDCDEEDVAVPELSAASEEESTDTENAQYLDTLSEGPELNGVDMTHLPSVFELAFSALCMGGVKALANGKVEITVEKIIFPLRDSLGESVTVAMTMSQLCTYSLLDGQELQSSGLVQQEEVPPPSLLLLFVSDNQAQQLHNDLSVIQPGTRPAEGSACVCVYLHECVLRVEQALLASVMDIVGLRHGNSQLLSPLKLSESLDALRDSGDTHLIQLLSREHITHTPHHTHTPQPQPETHTQPDASTPTEPEPGYTLLHSRHQGRYSVQVAKPGPEWIPYKHRGPARRLIQFPPPPCKGAITVTTEDLECLDSGQFLNDVIIDFYLKYLIAERTPQELAERCHVFSSFFYKQLTRRDNANEDCTSTTAEHRRHQRVKTWTRNVDIFSKDFLFVPVNQESHWYLVVVCYPGLEEARSEPFDGPAVVRGAGEESSGEPQDDPQAQEPHPDAPAMSDADKETTDPVEESNPSPPDCTEKTCKKTTVWKRPCILIMDSLKLTIHKRVVKLLREYLQVEWEVRRSETRDFSPEVMLGSSCKVPLQDNSSDCGLYLLHYAETFLQDPVVHFDLPLRLERWFPRQQVRRKRDEIRNLVLRLCRFQSGMMGSVVPRGAPVAQ